VRKQVFEMLWFVTTEMTDELQNISQNNLCTPSLGAFKLILIFVSKTTNLEQTSYFPQVFIS
jgi:hypothetical protein